MNVTIMAELEPVIAELVEHHLKSRRLWMPSDLLPRSHNEEKMRELRVRTNNIPNEIRAVLALNTLTEDGLPSFHRLLAIHLGDDSYWKMWIDLWTAEEDRHGAALDQYICATSLLYGPEFERLRYNYLLQGFRPDWSFDPLFMIIAYTVIQEVATQISHRNVAKAVKETEPTLCEILGRIAGEEGKHAYVYRSVFEKMLTFDLDRGLQALWQVIRSFTMPGVSMPIYGQLAYVAMRTGIFTPADFGNIVRDLIARWQIAHMHELSSEGSVAQRQILAFPERQERRQEKLEGIKPRSFNFLFLSAPFCA